ncbi:MAG TPA: carboxypeptidase-like regulatory domain-containing protein [Ignavibacteria bacterium]|nr:carboxypeptidase-like regulatory domain-containing protein [Ignavibacteria bacterium]
MRTFIFLILGALVIFGLNNITSADITAANFIIEVRDSNGTPVQNALVTIQGSSSPQQGYTNFSGKILFSNIPNDTYTLCAQKDNLKDSDSYVVTTPPANHYPSLTITSSGPACTIEWDR